MAILKNNLWNGLLRALVAAGGTVVQAADVSGAYYDWKKTKQPEAAGGKP